VAKAVPQLIVATSLPVPDSSFSKPLLLCGLELFRGCLRLREISLYFLAYETSSHEINRTCLSDVDVGAHGRAWPLVAVGPAEGELFGVGLDMTMSAAFCDGFDRA